MLGVNKSSGWASRVRNPLKKFNRKQGSGNGTTKKMYSLKREMRISMPRESMGVLLSMLYK